MCREAGAAPDVSVLWLSRELEARELVALPPFARTEFLHTSMKGKHLPGAALDMDQLSVFSSDWCCLGQAMGAAGTYVIGWGSLSGSIRALTP